MAGTGRPEIHEAPAALALLRALPLAAAIVDRDGRTVDANEGWALEGLTADDLARLVRPVLEGEREVIEAELRPEGRGERWRQVRAASLGPSTLVLVQDVTARRMLEATVREVEGREAQTGLVDGTGTVEVLSQRLAIARQRGLQVAVAQVEVLGLDRVRSELGAPAAVDLVVQLVARVRRAVRDDDIVCRIAEDRLLLIFGGLGEVGLDGLAGRLLGVLRAPCSVAGRGLVADAVIGRVVVPHGASAQDALDAVDEDVRARREAAGSDGQVADVVRSSAGRTARPDEGGRSPDRPTTVAAGLFRPVHDARSGRLVGAEMGEVAAEPGALRDALRSAGRFVAAWRRAAPDVLPVVVVPLPSGWELDAERNLDEVRAAAESGAIDPSALIVRVSGDDLAGRPGPTSAALARLRARGVRVLLDDAATMNVPVLQMVGAPLDLIRVGVGEHDGALELSVRTSILAAVVGAAGALGLSVMAAGVVPERDGAGLAALGVALVQPAAGASRSGAELLAELRAERSRPVPEAGDVARGADGPAVDDLDAAFRAMAHEVRTPLTVAMGYASLLEGADDPIAASASGAILRAAERINRLLRIVEDVRMIDQGELVLEPRDLDLRALVARVVDEQRDLVGVPVALRDGDAAGPPIPVTIDEARIEQVLINLISNAAKFSELGAPIEVRLSAPLPDRPGWTAVSVVDRGPGIPAAQLPRIFEKYGRADRTRPGSGLGLYLAQGVVRAHGGDITYRHRRTATGSVFSVVLPSSCGDGVGA
ncbi:MAG: ATP-binding protein [Acidimicrobiales bacterium]